MIPPQDVWGAAEAEAAKYVEWLIPKPSEYGQAEFVLARSFARAILTERERCAEVADAIADEKDVMAMESADEINLLAYREGEHTAKQIATGIRRGDQP